MFLHSNLVAWKANDKKGRGREKRRKKKNIYICIPEEQISRRDVLNRNDLVDTEIFRHCRSRIYRHGWSPRAIMNLFRSTLRSFARNLLVPMLIEYSWSIVRKRIPGLQNLLKTPGEADARFMHRARSFRMYSWRAAVFPLQSSVNFKKRAAAYTGNGVETRASRMASLNTKFYFIFFFPLPPSPPLTFAIDRLLLLRVDRVHVPLSVDNQIPPKLRENTAAIGLAVGDDCSALTDSNAIRKGEDTMSFRSVGSKSVDFTNFLTLPFVKSGFIRGRKGRTRREEGKKKIEAEGNISGRHIVGAYRQACIVGFSPRWIHVRRGGGGCGW